MPELAEDIRTLIESGIRRVDPNEILRSASMADENPQDDVDHFTAVSRPRRARSPLGPNWRQGRSSLPWGSCHRVGGPWFDLEYRQDEPASCHFAVVARRRYFAARMATGKHAFVGL